MDSLTQRAIPDARTTVECIGFYDANDTLIGIAWRVKPKRARVSQSARAIAAQQWTPQVGIGKAGKSLPQVATPDDAAAAVAKAIEGDAQAKIAAEVNA